jgi:hypothetical protein
MKKTTMFNRHPVIAAIVVLASCALAQARAQEITVDTKVTRADIQTWLNSGDPRLVAWGAYFARVNADDQATPAMLNLAENWTPPESDRDEAGRAEINAMSDVLDTLIVRNKNVPPVALSAIASSFPNQSAILASRLPISEATPLLLTWYDMRNSEHPSPFPRIAAMLLSKAPPPGFAASVLAESEETLHVTVVSGNYGVGGGLGSSGGCGDGGGGAPQTGWPPLFFYGIEENAPHSHNPVLVRAGGDTITYVRIDQHTGWGSCFYPHPLTASTRVHLVVQMLGGDTKKIPWAVERQDSITYESDSQFLRELQDRVTQEEDQMRETARDLYVRGFLTGDEADSVRPKLVVTILDDRKAGSPPLPQPETRDPRTSANFIKP